MTLVAEVVVSTVLIGSCGGGGLAGTYTNTVQFGTSNGASIKAIQTLVIEKGGKWKLIEPVASDSAKPSYQQYAGTYSVHGVTIDFDMNGPFFSGKITGDTITIKESGMTLTKQ